MGLLRPEQEHHGRKGLITSYHHPQFLENMRPRWRGRWFFEKRICEESRLQEFLYKHSQRPKYTRFFFLGVFMYFSGIVGSYFNYKLNVMEDKWVDNYGQDVPHYRKMKMVSLVQVIRGKYLHFYKYRLFYFVEEQVIDPLNDNSLSQNKFEVYQFKRLIRAINYDKKRDESFDFLQIGEDDMEDYDDFV